MNKLFANVGTKLTTVAKQVKDAPATPKVMLITGITAIVGGGVWACVQTLKLEDKVDEAKSAIDHVKDLKAAGEYVVNAETDETAEYTPALYRKDLTWIYGRSILTIGKLYLPSVIATGVGIALVTGSNKILSDRLTQTSLALSAMTGAFDKYRKNVIADQGEEADQRYMLGYETKKNLEMNVIDPETGEIKTHKEKKIDVIEDVSNIASPYAFILNDCNFWTSDINYNQNYIDGSLNILQAKYDRDGFIYYYDILKQFGGLECVNAQTLAMSHQTGLIKGISDDDLRVKLIPRFLGSELAYKDILLMDVNCIGGTYKSNGEYLTFNDLVAGKYWKRLGL